MRPFSAIGGVHPLLYYLDYHAMSMMMLPWSSPRDALPSDFSREPKCCGCEATAAIVSSTSQKFRSPEETTNALSTKYQL